MQSIRNCPCRFFRDYQDRVITITLAMTMDLASLIDALSHPEAYPYPAGEVEVLQTHISVVFLAGPHAYKIKKPVNLGFLDFSTLEKRRHFCDQEVRLNRRLAADVYLGVVPVVRSGDRARMEGQGEIVEWAVKMERLPAEATLERRLECGQVGKDTIEMLARKIAAFHQSAEGGAAISAFGKFEVVAGNARENFTQSAGQVGVTLSRAVFDRLRKLTEQWLSRLRDTIENRASRGVPRDTHGDLHLEHVYFFPNRGSDELVIIDCIEFNDRFRFADPVADMAFLAMDLKSHGRRDLADVFQSAYFRATADDEGQTLLPFYTAYRAAVRGKVEGMKATEVEVPESERCRALARSRAHWLLALTELEAPERRPGLVLIGGLPGTGKSTLSRKLADSASFEIVRTDVVRKELAGVADVDGAHQPFGQGLYSPTWTEKTYAECFRRAEAMLFDGKRVIVDASFIEDKRRRTFVEAASKLGVPTIFLTCKASPDVVRARLGHRHHDASDADWAIYQQAARRWEDLSPDMHLTGRQIETGGAIEFAEAQALEALRQEGLTV